MGDKTGIAWTDATKICRKCGNEKQLHEFAFDRSRPDGRTYVCKICRNSISPDVVDGSRLHATETSFRWSP